MPSSHIASARAHTRLRFVARAEPAVGAAIAGSALGPARAVLELRRNAPTQAGDRLVGPQRARIRRGCPPLAREGRYVVAARRGVRTRQAGGTTFLIRTAGRVPVRPRIERDHAKPEVSAAHGKARGARTDSDTPPPGPV